MELALQRATTKDCSDKLDEILKRRGIFFKDNTAPFTVRFILVITLHHRHNDRTDCTIDFHCVSADVRPYTVFHVHRLPKKIRGKCFSAEIGLKMDMLADTLLCFWT